MSVEQSGREAWLEKYPEYFRPERSISYYNKGALLGFLLDLAIRQGSSNQHSLDDVMRRLNEDFAHRNRFFSGNDLKAIISSMAPHFEGVEQFFSDYVEGTRELDYDKFLGYGGLRLMAETLERASLGFVSVQVFDGPIQVQSVEPGSNAAKAGLEKDDILLEMNGRALHATPDGQLGEMKPGDKARFQVRRGKREFSLEFRLEAESRTIYRVEEMKETTAAQRRIRQGWLEGTTVAAREAGEQ